VSGVFNFKVWYEQNAAALSIKRKMRYSTDPDYRARVLNLNASARRARKVQQFHESEVERKARVVGDPPTTPWKSHTVEVDGVEVQAFTIGALARALGRSIQAIRLYEGQGHIPVTPHRSSKGDRLYTYDMVNDIRAVLERLGRTSPTGKVSRPAAKLFDVQMSTGEIASLPLFRISYLARECRRNISTIEHMENDSIFPITPLRAKRIRLYTVGMIQAAREAFNALDMGDLKREDLLQNVRDRWDALGLLSAKLVAAAEPTEKTKNEGLNGHGKQHGDTQQGG